MVRQSVLRTAVVAVLALGVCMGAMAKREKKAKDDEGDADRCAPCSTQFFVDAYAKVLGQPLGGGDIDMFLLRAQMVNCNMCKSSEALVKGRAFLFSVVETAERREAVQKKEAELAAAEDDEEKEAIQSQLDSLQDAAIQAGLDEGEYEKAELDEKQKTAVGNLVYNLVLAGVYEALTVKDAALMIKEGKDIVEKVKGGNPKTAMQLAKKIKPITRFVTKDLPAITVAVPRHTVAFARLISAIRAIRKNNEIEEVGEPKSGDTFKELDF